METSSVKRAVIGKPETWVEGAECPMCYTVLHWEERLDLRSRADQEAYPLTEAQKRILACACLHPGDYVIGGFF